MTMKTSQRVVESLSFVRSYMWSDGVFEILMPSFHFKLEEIAKLNSCKILFHVSVTNGNHFNTLAVSRSRMWLVRKQWTFQTNLVVHGFSSLTATYNKIKAIHDIFINIHLLHFHSTVSPTKSCELHV